MLPFTSVLGLSAFACTVFTSACFTKRDSSAEDWSYDTPTHWADNPSYGLCRNGTQQSPIPLRTNALSQSPQRPTFDYTGTWNGSLTNNGHGLAFAFSPSSSSSSSSSEDYTTLPQLHLEDGETVYLQSWHIHSPSEHVVDGDKSMAELHFVHVDVSGHERAVVGFRIDPSSTSRAVYSEFLGQCGRFPTSPAEPAREIADFDPSLALQQVDMLKKFWTYRGSLTTPPCTEGVRWFVAAEELVVGDEQLQGLLAVSRYSSRPTQQVWLHDVGR